MSLISFFTDSLNSLLKSLDVALSALLSDFVSLLDSSETILFELLSFDLDSSISLDSSETVLFEPLSASFDASLLEKLLLSDIEHRQFWLKLR